jgi:hypothetical protein
MIKSIIQGMYILAAITKRKEKKLKKPRRNKKPKNIEKKKKERDYDFVHFKP